MAVASLSTASAFTLQMGESQRSGARQDGRTHVRRLRDPPPPHPVAPPVPCRPGLLKVGVPQPWEKSKKNLNYVR